MQIAGTLVELGTRLVFEVDGGGRLTFEPGSAQAEKAAAEPSFSGSTTERYSTSPDDLLVLDSRTGLTWQKSGSAESMDYDATEKSIAALNAEAFGGYSDWRLPSDHELLSIVDRSRYNPAIEPAFDCKSAWYWTSTPYAPSSSVCAWIVNFNYGYVGGLRRDGRAFARAVRGPSPAGQ